MYLKSLLRHCLSGVLALCLAPAALAASVGLQHLELTDNGPGKRKLSVAVLYPTSATGPSSSIADNRVFFGHSMVKDAPIEAKAHPLVLLSHGMGGNWRNQLWLAKELVRQGYMVATVNHPGTTTGDINSSTGSKLWERPRDLSRVLDFLTTSPKWAASVDASQVAAMGHSLGGWTVVALGGGRFDPQRFADDCQQNSWLVSCTAYQEMGAGLDATSRALLAQPLRDKRITAVVSFDLGLARGMDPASLSGFPVPALIIGAGPHRKEQPSEMESGFLTQHMPAGTTQALTIQDAGHFSFLQRCKPGAAAILNEEAPGDGMICVDGGGRDRAAIHQQVNQAVSDFLKQAGFTPQR